MRETAGRDRAIAAEQRQREVWMAEWFVLPVLDVAAAYDADRGVFHVLLADERGSVELGLPTRVGVDGISASMPSACAVPVPLGDAPTWRNDATVFLQFRLATLDPLQARDATLLSVRTGNVAAATRTPLSTCIEPVPERAGQDFQPVVSTRLPRGLAPSETYHAPGCPETLTLRGVEVVGVQEAIRRGLHGHSCTLSKNWQRVVVETRPPSEFSTAVRPGDGITLPRVLRDVKPQYTADAMRAKVHGTVLLECVVMPDGSVGQVRVVRSLDGVFGLDQEAIKAARQFLFAPGMRQGEPVPVLVTLEFTFTLR